MTTRRHYIISYDVASTKEGDKRRSRVFDHLEERGDRAQFSVFFCALNPRELAQLRMDLDAIIHHHEDQILIVDLGQKLNRALAARVEELARYRSEFFGKLREALAGQRDVQIVGDRFVFQSEVLFASGSAVLQPGGEKQLASVAQRLVDISSRIPKNINWVLQVDGHTDSTPISNAIFPSNWELSAARAIAVVKFLHKEGIPNDRLVAAGYGQYQPLSTIDTARNRRIELKLTNR